MPNAIKAMAHNPNTMFTILMMVKSVGLPAFIISLAIHPIDYLLYRIQPMRSIIKYQCTQPKVEDYLVFYMKFFLNS